MNNILCMIGISLVIASILIVYQNMDIGPFKRFKELLNKGQRDTYKNIINERILIYNIGIFLGLLLGFFYYRYNKGKEYILCRVVGIVSIVILVVYYLFPKSPLLLYSLNTKEQTDAWADIYTEMKKRWSKSVIIGIIGYIIILFSIQ